jgi:membrane protein implicated in regulation of membrane protease activity
MRNDAPSANVVAFHLGVQPNGEEITMSPFNERSPALVMAVLAIIVAVLAFLWWRPIQRWALGIDELERRIETLEQRR